MSNNGNHPSKRVNEDALSYEDDALCFAGEPFTGIGYSEFPDGQLRREIHYVNGFPEGHCQEWYANGQLHSTWIALRGVAPAEMTEWYEDGLVKSLSHREHGIEVEYKEWNTSGELIVHRELQIGSSMHTVLTRMRKLKGTV